MNDKQENQKPTAAWWQPAVQLFGQVSVWIVFPIIVAVYLGRWLDVKYQRESFFYYTCVAVAFFISNIGIILTSISAMKKMKQDELQEKNERAK